MLIYDYKFKFSEKTYLLNENDRFTICKLFIFTYWSHKFKNSVSAIKYKNVFNFHRLFYYRFSNNNLIVSHNYLTVYYSNNNIFFFNLLISFRKIPVDIFYLYNLHNLKLLYSVLNLFMYINNIRKIKLI